MRNVIGNNVTLTLFGESHNEIIGAVLDGLKEGIEIDYEYINKMLARRRPNGKTDTNRIEADDYKIVSGIYNGYSTGAPICILIKNSNVNSNAYNNIMDVARPSHADYPMFIKYNGFNDPRGGGHTSGRITAPIVALGAICMKELEKKNIKIGCHILQCKDIKDKEFSNYDEEIDLIKNKSIPVINNIEGDIEKAILSAKMDNDSVGGILEVAINNLPVGIGEPWFSSLEGVISNAMFSIGGIKGIEFGRGFDLVNDFGSTFNDELRNVDGKIITKTNNNGGINGGLSNGMPVVFRLAVKPTPSIYKSQETINLKTKENVNLEIEGRHDPAIIRRICVVVEALLAIVITDMMSIK